MKNNLLQSMQQIAPWKSDEFRSMLRSKRVLIPVAAVALIVIALLVVPALIDINTYRGQIAGQLEQQLGRPVTLGLLSLSILPSVKIKAADVAIGDDPKFAQGAFITARSVRLDVRLGSLLSGKPEVRAVELTEPVVTLIKDKVEKKEAWNWSTLKPLQSTEASAELPPVDIVIEKGRFTLIDRSQKPPAESVYSGIDVAINNFSARSVSDFTLAITLPGEQAGRVEIKGTAGPETSKGSAQAADANYTAKITAGELKAGKTRVSIAGQITHLLDRNQSPRAHLEVATQDAQLGDLIKLAQSLGAPADFSASGVLTLKAAIDADFGQPNSAMKITGDGKLSQARLQPPAAKPLEIAAADLRFTGEGLHVAIPRLAFEKFTATDLQSQISFKDQMLNLNPLSFGICGGRYQGQVKVDLAERESRIAVGGNFNGVDVNQFLSAASAEKSVVYGHAGGTLNLRSRGRGFDPKTMSGSGHLTVADGRVTSFDLAKEIGVLGKLSGLPTTGSVTDFRSLNTDYRFEGGQIFTDNLRLEMSEMNVTGRGVLRLGEPVTCDHDLLAQLSRALASKASGGNVLGAVGGILVSQSMAGVPVKMSGPVTQPHFTLNPGAMGKQAASQIVNRPQDAVKGIFDLFKSGDKTKSDEKKKKF